MENSLPENIIYQTAPSLEPLLPLGQTEHKYLHLSSLPFMKIVKIRINKVMLPHGVDWAVSN